MIRTLIAILVLSIGTVMLLYGGAVEEAAAEVAREGMKPFMELPIEGQAEYNLPDYERLTGDQISQFNEAPMLAELVKAGDLPHVTDRLPNDVLVRVPLREIGRYGGTINLPIENFRNTYPGNQLTGEMLFILDLRRPNNIAPGIAKGYELSDDQKTYTMYLRDAMKWSDGHPLTSDDFLFWWEDVMLNEELTPSIPLPWRPADKPMTMERVDDYTIRYHFDVALPNVPFYFAQNVLVGAQQGLGFLPKHELTKYHIKYNSDAGKLAKTEGVDEWWQLFREKKVYLNSGMPREQQIPSTAQYILETVFENGRTWVRNPYYHGVDPVGNQLPYIDRVRTVSYEDDRQILKLRTIAGDYDYVTAGLSTTDFPLLATNAEQGGYDVYLVNGANNQYNPLFLNQNSQEPVLGDLLRNKQFRYALSLAVDRQEIVDVVTLGMATITQSTVHPTNSLWEERYANAYIEHDPATANRMLDELGLSSRDREGFRVMSNGKTLSLLIEPTTGLAGSIETAELVKDHWEAIGVKVAIKAGTYGSIFGGQGHIRTTGQYHVAMILTDMGTEVTWRLPGYWNGPRNTMRINWTAPLWDRWQQTRGKEGLEPPEDVKRILYLAENMNTFPEDEWRKAGKEILDWWAENFYMIGIYGYQQNPVVSAAKLGNIDRNTIHTGPVDFGTGYISRLWQIYWKE